MSAFKVTLAVAATGVAAACIGIAAHATAPGKNGLIAFRRYFDAQHHTGAIFVINPDGSSERQLTQPPQGGLDAYPGFAPNGSGVVFVRTDAQHKDSVWRVNSDGSGARKLKTIAGMPGDGDPRYSPNSKLIAVGRAWPPEDKFHDFRTALYVMSASGAHPRVVANFGFRADVGKLSWSPDGKRIVFSVHNNGPGRPTNATTLFVVGANGRGLRRLVPWDTRTGTGSPDWSPDGSLILFQRAPRNSDFGGNYFTVHPDGSKLRQLTHLTSKGLALARFAPDGKSIVFADTGIGGNDDVYTMQVDGTGKTAVTQTPDWESTVDWGPAG